MAEPVPSSHRLPWGAFCLGGAVLVCLMVTAIAMLQAPDAVALGRRTIESGLVMTLREHEAPSRYWRAHLTFDASLAPPPAWSLDLMRDDQLQLQVAWDPNALALVISHIVPDVTAGTTRVVLGQVTLERSPRELWITRRDRRIELTCDRDPTLSGFVPTWMSAETRWRLVTEGTLGQSRVTVHLDRHLEQAAVAETDGERVLDRPRAEELVQAACSELADEDGRTLRAMTAAHLLGPGGRDLLWWLAWQQLRRSLASDQTPDAEWDRQLSMLVTTDQQLGHGLLASLLPTLVDRACAPPAAALAPQEWLEQRRRWLHIIHQTASALADHPDPSPAIDTHTALLTAHVAGALTGLDLAPTPADAPAWMADHWRLAAGRPALNENSELVLSPAPSNISQFLTQLFAYAGLDRPHEVAAASLARQATAEQPELAEAALAMVHGRQRWLLHGLLAVAGVIPSTEARQQLANDQDGPPPIERNALAYAMHHLLAARAGETLSPFDSEQLPPALAPYSRLLDGRAGAPLLVTTLADDRLPPLQALAVALACQEVAGHQPDWTLLADHRSLALPLELLIPTP